MLFPRISPRTVYLSKQFLLKKFYSTPATPHSESRIRNIGILAHIDAGKTTLTERMLYYSGYTNKIGDVDSGSTVTDYLPQERDRGITITSACIPLSWPPAAKQPHQINLIDTPGHIDFSLEVTRTTRVLDSGILLLDGVAGVQAQTHTVFRQSQMFKLPLLVLVNKMDREGSSVSNAVKSMEKLKGISSTPVVLQIPVVLDGTAVLGKGNGGNGLCGVLDFVDMVVLQWNKDGSMVSKIPIAKFVDDLKQKGDKMVVEGERLMQEARQGRSALVETLAQIDDAIVETFFSDEINGDHLKLSPSCIRQSLRRVTVSGAGTPVFCGSAFKNIGVQPVMDGVVDYLPSPLERPNAVAVSDDGKELEILPEDKELCALAFKIVHDEKRGPLVFVRVYSGILDRSALLNSSQNKPERASKILQMYADDFEEIPSITPGNIGALVGLRYTCTGDTLLSAKPPYGSTLSLAKHHVQLAPIPVPSPVFMASIKPKTPGKTAETQLSDALALLQREDPSVRVSLNEETSQTVVSGMGELHLEIVADRLRTSYRVPCDMGTVRINYRETVIPPFLVSTKTSEEVDLDEGEENTQETEDAPKKMKKSAAFTQDEKVSASYEYIAAQDGSSTSSKVHHATVTLELQPLIKTPDDDGLYPSSFTNTVKSTPSEHIATFDGNMVVILRSARTKGSNQVTATKKKQTHPPKDESTTTTSSADDSLVDAVIAGVKKALSSSAVSFPFTNLQITCTEISGPGVSQLAVREAAFGCARRLITRQRRLGTMISHSVVKILEPIMTVTVSLPEQHVGAVVRDLGGQRRANIVSLGSDDEEEMGEIRNIVAKVPLKNLVGYATVLRGLSSGSGEFTMKMNGYGVVPGDREADARKDLVSE